MRDEITGVTDGGTTDFPTGTLLVNGVAVAGGGGGGGTPGGTGGQVQFEDTGAFGVIAAGGEFIFQKAKNSLKFGNIGTSNKQYLYAYANGSFGHGYMQDNANAFSKIYAGGKGATAQGYVDNPRGSGQAGIYAFGKGTFSGGCINLAAGGGASGAYITAQSDGSFAHGYTDGPYAQIYAGSRGSMAIGAVVNDSGKIRTGSGNGGFACGGVGPVTGNGIYAYAGGAVAMGYDYGSASLGIRSTGKGAFAMGYTNAAAIQAQAKGCMQFGPGSNNEPYTISCGDGIRLNPAAAPSIKRDGDMWVNASYTYIRSNGIDVKIT